jgi:ADP-ribose pyrophosphatase YjhB (NUDIX family)
VLCTACGAAHWHNAKPAGAALVVHDGRLLLTRRAIEPWRGTWCAPSGFCETNEHPAACAEREALEEAGIRVRVIGYLGIWIDEYLPAADAASEAQYCAVSYYHAVPVREAQPRLRGDHEVAEVSWFAPDALPTDLSPPASGPRIYSAWRHALAADNLETPLPDVSL